MMRRNLVRMLVLAVTVAGMAAVSAPRDAHAVSLNLINNWRMGNLATLGGAGTGGVAASSYYTSAVGSAGWIPD